MLRAAGSRRGRALGVCAFGMALIAVLSSLSVRATAASLPDGRGFELVSPSAKNGGDVASDVGRTRAAVSGDAVDFASPRAFGDVHGTGRASEYISERTGERGTSGWTTHGIFPHVDPLTFQAAANTIDTTYQAEFSDDLSKGVLESYTPLTADPAVAGVLNLYLREDALTPGLGSYTLLSACPGCSSPLSDPAVSYRLQVADETSDLGHITFEANRQLTADAPPEPASCTSSAGTGCQPNLYEWDHGTLRFVGILPDGTSAPASIAGLGALNVRYTFSTMSSDGSRIFFTVPFDVNNDDDGRFESGNLYMRVDQSSTVQLNVPEPGVSDPAGPQPAIYHIATPDGHKVLFTSPEQLTAAPGGDLYLADTTLPLNDPNRLTRIYADNQPADGTNNGTTSVVGMSDDGSYVYFTNPSALVPGQRPVPGSNDGLYLWHEGTVTFIGFSQPATQYDGVETGWTQPKLSSRVSPDGKTLVFTAFTGTGLTRYNHGDTCGAFGGAPCAELYVYRADANKLACISCNPTGAPATSDAIFTARGIGGAATSSHLTHALTVEGDRLFFDTGDRLLPTHDVNGSHRDVYEWTLQGTHGCTTRSPGYTPSADGCLSLITPGDGAYDAHFLDATPTGSDIFFSTNEHLVGWDTDNNYDLYDARIGGGFPTPPAPRRKCLGETCRGILAPPPTFSLPASATVHSKSKKPRRCHKGQMRKHVHGKVKCVKRRRAARHHRRT